MAIEPHVDALAADSGPTLLAALAPAAGDDIVIGDHVFSNAVSGGDGADLLTDLSGSTVLTGGADADVFKFELPQLDVRDLVTDYAPEDRIDLTALLKVSAATAALADQHAGTSAATADLADSFSYLITPPERSRSTRTAHRARRPRLSHRSTTARLGDGRRRLASCKHYSRL